MTDSPDDGKTPRGTPEMKRSLAPEDQPAETEIIPLELDTALRTAGVDTRDPKISKAVEMSLEMSLMMYSGTLPLPPPPMLAAYNDAFPGVVEKIISWTDQQRDHRFNIERTRVVRSEDRLDRSQRNAFIIALAGSAEQ
jgi:hypothetical protein